MVQPGHRFEPVGNCYQNGAPLGSQNSPITGYDGGTITVNVPADTTYFITIHLDYGFKGTTGWTKDASVATTAVSTYGTIVNLRSYIFSAGAGIGNSTVQSENIFKKNPGIAGQTRREASGNSIFPEASLLSNRTKGAN